MILSTTIIYIVEFLRLKVMLLALVKKEDGDNYQSQAAGANASAVEDEFAEALDEANQNMKQNQLASQVA